MRLFKVVQVLSQTMLKNLTMDKDLLSDINGQTLLL
jgi:hypothetical protein